MGYLYLVISNTTDAILYVGPLHWAEKVMKALAKRNVDKNYHLEPMDENEVSFDNFIDTVSFSDLDNK